MVASLSTSKPNNVYKHSHCRRWRHWSVLCISTRSHLWYLCLCRLPLQLQSCEGEWLPSYLTAIRRWDYIVVSTKALPDVSDDSTILEGLVSDKTAIVLIQNGLGVEEPYAKRFPQAAICSAVTIATCAQPEHGQIKHNRWTRINSGPYLPHLDTGNVTEQNDAFIALLKEGGIKDAEAYSHAKLQLVRWHKIAINASMNPTSVLTQCLPNNVMSLDPELQRHLKGVMLEILETAPKILGEPMPKEFATPDQIIRSTQKNTSGSKPSMAIDWEAGKKMEIEVILGNPLRIARDRGFEMPRLQSLYAMVRMAQEVRDQKKDVKL